MAISMIGAANTQIGPAAFADLTTPLAPRFVCDGPTDLQPSYDRGTITVQPGSCWVSGARITLTGTNTATVPSVASGSAWGVLVLRVDWTAGTAKLVYLVTNQLNNTAPADTAKINRVPGVMYDALICQVQRTAGSTSATAFKDYRVWGGDGGPLRSTSEGVDTGAGGRWFDLRPGSMLATEDGSFTKLKRSDGTWSAIGTDSNPWRLWTPTMRFYGTGTPNGTTGGTVAGMGSGSSVSARYRVVDGMLDGYIYIQAGATGATWGDGPVTIDLPMQCASWQEDTWSMGHLFTTGYSSDGSYDWHAEMLIKRGWTRGMLWTNPTIGDTRLKPYMCQRTNGGAGTGVPYINGGFPVGTWTFHINYPVSET